MNCSKCGKELSSQNVRVCNSCGTLLCDNCAAKGVDICPNCKFEMSYFS
ncbi:MAG: zinc-ribbon domain-containing protein [Clostridia bacterium]